MDTIEEGVKTTIGYEMPLSDDTYSKEKAVLFVSFTIKNGEVDEDHYQEVADKKATHLADLMEKLLIKKGIKMIDKLVDKKVEEIRKEYESKLTKARELVKLNK